MSYTDEDQIRDTIERALVEASCAEEAEFKAAVRVMAALKEEGFDIRKPTPSGDSHKEERAAWLLRAIGRFDAVVCTDGSYAVLVGWERFPKRWRCYSEDLLLALDALDWNDDSQKGKLLRIVEAGFEMPEGWKPE
jgi:hypothetical protein